MPRLAVFVVLLMAAALGNAWLEVREVRRDQDEMLAVYEQFLAQKVGGKPLSERLRPETVALFKTGADVVACGLVKRGEDGQAR